MVIALAQTSPIIGDLDYNLKEHCEFIKLASGHGADLIAFPEMSLTGYVRDTASELSFTENDPRLEALRKLAVENNIIIVAGAPIRVGTEMHIGSFVLFPDNQISIYTKQFLYTGEEVFFTPSLNYNPLIELDNNFIRLAICADIMNPEHPKNQNAAGAAIYIAGICFSEASINNAHEVLSDYARTYSMSVLMSNVCGEFHGIQAGGRSAIWSEKGDLIAELNGTDRGLLLASKNGDVWTGEVVQKD